MRTSPALNSHRLRVAIAVIGAACALSAASRDASAQGVGWNLDRFDPTPAGDIFFTSPAPVYSGSRPFQLRAALTTDYAYRPLVVSYTGGTSPYGAAVEHMLVLHTQVSAAFFDRLAFDISIPFVLVETGAVLRDVPVMASNHASVGDVRLGVRARIWGHSDRDPWSVHVGLAGYLGSIGYNQPADNATDGGFRGRAYIAAAGRLGPVRWSFATGYHARPTTTVLDITTGSELYGSVAVAIVALHDRLAIGPELFASTVAARAFQRHSMNAEALLGIHYLFAGTWLAGVAAGPGLTQAEGTPQFRALLQFAYAPEPPRELPRTTVASSSPPASVGPSSSPPPFDSHSTETASHSVASVGAPGGEGAFCPQGSNTSDCLSSDRDHDGVRDVIDECPDTSAGVEPDPTRAGCPDGDVDADGVADHRDVCPTVAQGPTPDRLRPGCPLLDRDGDLVADAVDHCPDQPGAPSADPLRNGCPGLVRLEATSIQISDQVYFATARDRVLPRSYPVLAAVVDTILARPDIWRVSIEGHTDNAGNDELNVDLSQRRATSVMLWLADHGVAPERLEAHGYGAMRPIASNGTVRGRATNRRVEFHVLTPAPASVAPTAQPAGGTTPATRANASDAPNTTGGTP